MLCVEAFLAAVEKFQCNNYFIPFTPRLHRNKSSSVFVFNPSGALLRCVFSPFSYSSPHELFIIFDIPQLNLLEFNFLSFSAISNSVFHSLVSSRSSFFIPCCVPFFCSISFRLLSSVQSPPEEFTGKKKFERSRINPSMDILCVCCVYCSKSHKKNSNFLVENNMIYGYMNTKLFHVQPWIFNSFEVERQKL